MSTRIRLAAAVVGAAALLSACGGGTPSESASPATVTVTAEPEAPATVTKTATVTVTAEPEEPAEPTNASSGLTDDETLEVFREALENVWESGEVDTKVLCKGWLGEGRDMILDEIIRPEGVDQDYIEKNVRRIITEHYDEKCAEAAEAATSDGYVLLGETWVYADGLEITVSKPKDFQPSNTAAGGEGYSVFKKFTITITNNTNQPYEPLMAMVDASADGYEGDQIFDSAQGMGMAPSTTVRPGKSISWDVAFGLNGTKDLQVEVEPDFINYETAIFVSE